MSGSRACIELNVNLMAEKAEDRVPGEHSVARPDGSSILFVDASQVGPIPSEYAL